MTEENTRSTAPVASEAGRGPAEPGWTEADRLAAVERYGILDTEQEAAFDEIAALAADLLEAPIALVNLIAADRQFFKAKVGVGPDRETPPLDLAICRHALRQGGVMVVPDLRDDQRFDGNPLVHGELGLRFYAGALLETPEGLPLGTLCVLGRDPRPEGISERQRRALATLASQVMAQIELRRAQREAKEAAHRQAFLLRLSDALRPLGDPDEIRFAAACVLGEHLGASRVAYAEDLGDGRYAVQRNYVNGAADAQGVHRYEEFGPALLADLQAGRGHVRPDIRNDLGLSEAAREALAALGIGASLNLPVVKDGRLVAFLGVSFPDPHAFTGEEVDLVQAVVERSWDAVERARAQAALRVSEERHRRTLEIDTVGIVYFDMGGVVTDANDAYLRLVDYSREELEAGEVRYENPTPRDGRWRDERTIAELYATGQSGPFEKECLRRDGTRLWLLCASKLLDARTAVEFVVDVTERREAEAALAEGEERLRLATDHAEVGFWDVEEGHGTLTWPPRVKAMFGISADRPVTMEDFYAGLHPDDRPRVAEAYVAAADPAARALYDVEYRTIGKEDGVTRWVAAKGRGVFDGDGPAARCLRVLGTAIDITERKTAEEALRASESRLRLLGDLDDALRQASTASGAMDAATELLSRRLGASRCAYADVDADEDRFVIRSDHSAPGLASSVGIYSLDLFGPRAATDMREGRTLVVRDVEAELAPGEGRETFLSIGIGAIVCCPLVKDGRLLAMMALHQVAPRDWRPDEIALAEAVVDRCWAHVERVGAGARLRESEERLRAILETARDYAIFTTDPDGRIETWPRGAQEVFGWTAEEAVGQSVAMTYTPEDRARSVPEQERQDARATGQAPNVRWHVRKDGKRVFIDGIMRPLDGKDGAPAGFVKVGQDVTERRRSEEQLHLATDAAALGIFDVDLTTATMEWNARQREIWGLGPDAVVTDEVFLAGLHPDDRDRVQDLLARAFDPEGEGIYSSEFRVLPGGRGPERWISATGRVHFEGSRPARLIGTVQDISERKRTEAALRESEAQFRAFAQAVPNHVWAAHPDGTLFWFNDQVYAYSGEAAGSLDGAGWARLVHPDDLPAAAATWAHALATGEAYETEFRIRGAHVSHRWFLVRAEPVRGADGTILAWVGTNTDIHDRRRAEAALRSLNETLEQEVEERTAERNQLWVLSQDMLARANYQGMMSAVSPAWTRVLGWSEKELLARPYASFMHPDDMAPTLAALERMDETGLPTRFENRIATRDGGWKPIEWTVAPEPGAPNFIAVGRDVSAERERQAELEQAQEALRQSQKMEAMGQLTGGVAHDFNNLLTPIIASLDMLLRRGVGNQRERRLMDGSLQSAERAKVLVQRLLAFARRQPLQPRPVDVGDLVANMSELIASTTGPRIQVRLEMPPDLPPALADANQLEMAMLNLAVNARDAMPESGVLTVSGAHESVRGRHRAGLRPGHYVRLSVADTGTGMDEATLARAIEPFFSTKGIGKGTGLGLSMVHGLATQLGGGLAIASAPGQGTTVDLWLPVSPFAVEPDARAPSGEEPAEAQGTALLVDDEDLVRMSTAEMLMDLGYTVVEAASAEEALRRVNEGLDPDLVVTDHLMPGMSGVELAREMRARRPSLPVLIVSGYAEVDGIAPGLPRLPKPFRAAELARSLADLMADRLG